MEDDMEPAESPVGSLFVDGSSEDIWFEAGMVLVSLEGHKLNYAMRFNFKATNNAAEYEALFVDFRLAKEMQVKRLVINSDSQLVVSQVYGSFSIKDKSMAAYLKLVMEFVPTFEKYEFNTDPTF